VFGGMLTATLLAIFIVPVLYVLIEEFVERRRPAYDDGLLHDVENAADDQADALRRRARARRVRARSSAFSTTDTISRRYCSTPVAFAWPYVNASRQSATLASFSTIALKKSRRMSMRILASVAMSLVTVTEGISIRNC
jgi:hypothetical protein